MTTISAQPAPTSATTSSEAPDNTVSARPIYREDTASAQWTVGTKTVIGITVGAVLGTVALSWFGLVLGTAVGLGIGLLLDNRR
ncbi:hypothetical protein [Cellulosimicrobium arenosum]|uniref:Uncharacterized protein n=1 Tax=Cellulosimicrobium arenosum TaxID=2708133 RepID=A0A927G793_9MICO|nr:hypothetical protein [Cellulosimicrobium arenosum]MBD8078194.1 hypothetical protein [Cellulosimicrobium arenosum]